MNRTTVRFCALLPLLLAIVAATLAAQTTTPAAEREIGTIRAMRKDVEKRIRKRKLHRRDTVLACPGAPLSFKAALYTDQRGRARCLDLDGGTGDQAALTRYIYDTEGRLRYALAKRGAVNGTNEEEEIFYGAEGSTLRRQTRKVRGPGYPFAGVSPILHPVEFVRNPCN